MKTLKAFVLFLGLLMLTATQMNAQNKGGGLFGMGPSGEASPHRSLLNPLGGNITNQTYGSDADGFGITNQTYGQDAPLGSGLLMMAVAGACYAGMKRNKKQKSKTMRKYNFILMAFVLLLGMTQCKKEPATPNGDNNGGVRITLKVNDGESGEKLNVYPATGAVIFTQGDKIYVGNNGKYVGTLTFDNGLFQGTVSGDLSTNDYLHFYFVGNKPTYPSTLTSGTTTYTVNISDQSEGLPAISYAPSTAKYSPSTTAYTAKLLNKSALVKFVPSTATSQPITDSGLYNEVQIDFASHTLAPTGTTGGITLFSAGDSEKWAILLEQASLSGLKVSVYGYNATIEGLPESIINNMYYNSGVGISMTATYQTFVVTSSSPLTTIASFNAAEPIPTPKLYFETSGIYGVYLTRASGIVDFNGQSLPELFIQNNVEGESITLQNGTIGTNPIDGASGTGTYFKGTVIMENMTVNGRIFTDGHAFIIISGTYNDYIYCDTDSGYPGTTTIYGGYFTSLGFWSGTHGTFILYGGKYKNRPDDSWCAEGYAVKSNTDADSGTYPWVVSALPEGALKGEFTINGSGDKVYFSKGNLQYTKSTSVWSFMENQYDMVETLGQNVGEDYADQDVVSLFGYGTSGYNNNQSCYQPYCTQGDQNSYATYLNGTANWGYNRISNGGNTEDFGWYVLSSAQWNHVINNRTASTVNGTGNARYAKAKVAGVKGLILFPDSYTHPDGVAQPIGINVAGNDEGWNGNNYTASDFGLMEAHGAVFLPATGGRASASVSTYVGAEGSYWSSTYHNSISSDILYFLNVNVNPTYYSGRYRGLSVRLVRNVQ